jgi:IclR-like helix-turn-helix domain-containing protein
MADIGQVVAGIRSADANGNREQVQVTAEAKEPC